MARRRRIRNDAAGIREAMLAGQTGRRSRGPFRAQNTGQQRVENERIRHNAADKATPRRLVICSIAPHPMRSARVRSRQCDWRVLSRPRVQIFRPERSGVWPQRRRHGARRRSRGFEIVVENLHRDPQHAPSNGATPHRRWSYAQASRPAIHVSLYASGQGAFLIIDDVS